MASALEVSRRWVEWASSWMTRRGGEHGQEQPGTSGSEDAAEGAAYQLSGLQQRGRVSDGFDVGWESIEDRAPSIWYEALIAQEENPARVPTLVARLASLPAAAVDSHAEWLLKSAVGGLWQRGWQPAELRRYVRLETRALVATLVELAIQADHAGRTGRAVDPRWADQVAGLGEGDRSVRGPWLSEWRERNGLARPECYDVVLLLCRIAGGLVSIDVLIPYPGAPKSAVVGAPMREVGAHPMLDRIRKLLAKAEATDFEEESASFTAKAQQLMTRYAIDEARVHRDDLADVPRMIRVPINARYADAKAMLLGIVASANRCRAVQLGRLHMSSVFGHAGDLGVVEMLFTSLLVQAQKALAEAGRKHAGGRTRSASYRSSSLQAYAGRIHERLNAATGEVLGEEANAAALPVLRSREAAAVEELVNQRYGDSAL